MGWCSGDALLGSIWGRIRDHVPEEERVELISVLIEEFEYMDMDCYDCIEEFPEGKEALRKLHPDWYEDEDHIS